MVVVLFATKKSENALKAWRLQPEHVATQQRAREAYYEGYWVEVCQTVRSYSWDRERGYRR